MFRSFPVLRVLRALARSTRRPRMELPAPGPAPLTGPSWQTVAILVVVTGGGLWLLARGLSVGAAAGVLTGLGLLAAELTALLAGPGSRDR